jgi:hypothetical protein
MQPDVSDRVEPILQLSLQIVAVAERPRQEEILADVAERPLHPALRLGPVGPAGAGMEAIVLGQSQVRAIVGDVILAVLAPVTAVFMRS